MADKKVKNVQGITPKGIAKYPRLNVADTKFKAEGLFTTKLVLSEEDATPFMEVIKEESEKALVAAREALEEKLAEAKPKDKPKIKKALDELSLGDYPFTPEYDDEGEETGNYEFSFKTNASFTDKKTGKTVKREVTMFDAKGNKLEGSKRPSIWGGSVLKCAYMLAPYYNAATATAGVSTRLNAVQIIELVSGGGGSAKSYGFGEEEGYEASEAQEDSPFSDDEGTEQAGGKSEDDEDF